jgi:hypothetical protein
MATLEVSLSTQGFSFRKVGYSRHYVTSKTFRQILVDWRTQVSGFVSRQRQEVFHLLHSVRTGSGAHAVSYPTDAEGSFYGCKAAGV